MWRVYGGVFLVAAAVVALVEAHNHHPVGEPNLGPHADVLARLTLTGPGPEPWSQTAYDLVRVCASALTILGVSMIVLGLIRGRAVRSRLPR